VSESFCSHFRPGADGADGVGGVRELEMVKRNSRLRRTEPLRRIRSKRIIVLGATGSIGATTLDVVRDFADRFQVVGLSAHRNVGLLKRQVEEFSPRAVCVSDAEAARKCGLASDSFGGAEFLMGEGGLSALVEGLEADLLVVATVGFAGLLPTLKGIERGLAIALANKEILVAAGEIIVASAREAGVPLLPIDSEHSAVFQCLEGNHAPSLRRVVLTASGGPFRGWSREAIESATPEEALQHPTWTMGRKITIDSATLMNKGFEVIEACHLFHLRPDQIDVLIHPGSTVHSMVEFNDGSVLAQMGQTDMYLPILHAVAYPDRLANKFPPLDLAALGALEFSHPDRRLFPCLDYAYEAISTGGTMPAAMSAANEVAVDAFLRKRIPFGGIARTVRAAMDAHTTMDNPNLDVLREADRQARETAERYVGNMAR